MGSLPTASVWKTARLYQEKRKAEIKAFLKEIRQKHDYIKVILTGADILEGNTRFLLAGGAR